MQAAWDAADTSKDEHCVELEMAWPAIRDELKAWREFGQNVRDNFDCDRDAHKYGTRCRCCDAQELLEGLR